MLAADYPFLDLMWTLCGRQSIAMGIKRSPPPQQPEDPPDDGEYFDNLFEADWSRGRLLYTALTPSGATYTGREDLAEFVHGEPRKWTLARFTLHTPNVLRLEGARNDVFGDATTAQQRERILAAALKSGVLFADFCVCMRAAKD